ncbi:hypothetical protein M33023_01820 [Candidatus Phytoplasma asteris]|uniref:DUF2963 domain-containing protein n=1 Tax=Candidatus Phytoplasma asteris TaxID=85620 RepID=A0ABZ2YFU6_9MOLU
MSSFRIGNKHYKIIPFLITTGTLLFFVFWIGGISYKYHLETEERRKLQEVDIKAKARELNNDLHNENKKLKKENEYMKDTPYEFQRDNGEKEYYNLFTNKLVKKIDKDDTIREYDKNNGLLLKKTDRYNNVEEYGSHGKLIKKTLSDGVWTEFNPVNDKMVKRKNIDNSIEEFDDNEEKFKEIDKNGKVKYFKTKIYKTVSDFKELSADIFQLKDTGFTAKQLKEAAFTAEQLKNAGYTIEELKEAAFTAEQLKNVGFTFKQLKDSGFTGKDLDDVPITKSTLLNPSNGKIFKETFLNYENKKIKEIYYLHEKIDNINEYDPQTSKLIKETFYLPDGTIDNLTIYNLDGTIKETKTF